MKTIRLSCRKVKTAFNTLSRHFALYIISEYTFMALPPS